MPIVLWCVTWTLGMVYVARVVRLMSSKSRSLQSMQKVLVSARVVAIIIRVSDASTHHLPTEFNAHSVQHGRD